MRASTLVTTGTEHLLKDVLLELLLVFDAICKKHHIQYMLFAGTALGAVRHSGFIPWDDDLDIVMLRSEYERFLHIAPTELDADTYYLQAEFSNHWPMFFTKLRKNNTACIEKFIPKDPEIHQGIYIDIFPCDNLADSKIVRKLQFFASKAIIAKSLARRGYATDSMLKKAFMAVCRLVPAKPLHHFVMQKGRTNSKYVHTFLGASSKFEKSIYPRTWFTESTQIHFENNEFPISAHFEPLLTTLYGDYRVIPTAEERQCKQHGVIVDTERSYTEYLETQKNMQIDSFSRSIR